MLTYTPLNGFIILTAFQIHTRKYQVFVSVALQILPCLLLKYGNDNPHTFIFLILVSCGRAVSGFPVAVTFCFGALIQWAWSWVGLAGFCQYLVIVES